MICSCFVLSSRAQQLRVKGKVINGTEAQPNYWVFSDSKDTIVALDYKELLAITDSIKKLTFQVEFLKSEMERQNRKITAYKEANERAETHINNQKNIISHSDSLIKGYKSIYNDLKAIYNKRKFGLLIGAGTYKYSQENASYLFDAGFEYNKMQIGYQFGDNFKGLTIRYRFFEF